MSQLEKVKGLIKQEKERTSEERIYQSFKDNILAWGMFYFPHHFRKQSPEFHLKILTEAKASRRLAIHAPRESAKSTVLNFLYTTHGIAFKQIRFVVLVQNTYMKAVGSLENIKKEFRDNQRLKTDYGVQIKKDREGDSIFRHPSGFETRFLCKGAEQIGSVRGEKFGAWRPDLILGDDMEDDEMVLNPDRRRKYREIFDEALIPAGDVDRCKFIFIGTILHDDAIMSHLISKGEYRDYRKLFYKARYIGPNTGEVKSLWEDKWTVAHLNALEKEKPAVFAKEYQGDPASGLRSQFNKSDFRRWTVENMIAILFDEEGKIIAKHDLKDCKAAISCDLAWEQKRESDFGVIMPGFLTPNSELLIDEYICKKGMRPDEIEEILFSMEERLRNITGKSVSIGFEKAKLEKVMKWLLKDAMKRRNHYLIFKDLLWDADKITRIVTRLQPRYVQHSIYHKSGMGDLEHQLIRIPDGAHDDLPDAEQGLVQLLQYAPQMKKQPSEDSEFDWWRKQTILARKPSKERFTFGNKGKKSPIPAKESYR
jgi:hypothetical protein